MLKLLGSMYYCVHLIKKYGMPTLKLLGLMHCLVHLQIIQFLEIGIALVTP